MNYVGLSRNALISNKKQIKNLHLFYTREKPFNSDSGIYLLYCFNIIIEFYFTWNCGQLFLVKMGTKTNLAVFKIL